MHAFTKILATVSITLGLASTANATCRDTADLLQNVAGLNTQIANLKHKVELVAYATEAANLLAELRPAVEGFYSDIDEARHSCGYLKHTFEKIDELAQEAVDAVTSQGLTADDDINANLLGMRFGFVNVRTLVDRL